MRIALCVHAFETVDFDAYFNHLYLVAQWVKKYDFVFLGKGGLDAATARNRIFDRAIEEKCTHALVIDADHLLPVELLDCLVETSDEAMVSGVVCKKGERYQQVAFETKTDEEGKDQYFEVTHPLDGRVYEVSVCAFGCTLINLEKIQKLQKPWFRDDFKDGYNVRSDINLCKAFRKIGEKVWVDTRVIIGHLGPRRVIYPQTSVFFQQQRAIERELRQLKQDQTGHFFNHGEEK